MSNIQKMRKMGITSPQTSPESVLGCPTFVLEPTFVVLGSSAFIKPIWTPIMGFVFSSCFGSGPSTFFPVSFEVRFNTLFPAYPRFQELFAFLL